jgi:hypothetical protein
VVAPVPTAELLPDSLFNQILIFHGGGSAGVSSDFNDIFPLQINTPILLYSWRSDFASNFPKPLEAPASAV